VVQNACKLASIYLQLPSATSSPMLPVVSEWYRSGIKRLPVIRLEWRWKSVDDASPVPVPTRYTMRASVGAAYY
jgi:hypothetical protein